MLCFTILKLIKMLKNNISKIFFPEFKSIINFSWNEYMHIKNTKCLKWFVQFYYNSFQKDKGVSLCRIFFFTFLHLKLDLNYFLSKNNSLSIWAFEHFDLKLFSAWIGIVILVSNFILNKKYLIMSERTRYFKWIFQNKFKCCFFVLSIQNNCC